MRNIEDSYVAPQNRYPPESETEMGAVYIRPNQTIDMVVNPSKCFTKLATALAKRPKYRRIQYEVDCDRRKPDIPRQRQLQPGIYNIKTNLAHAVAP